MVMSKLINRDQLISSIVKMNPDAIPDPQKIKHEIRPEGILCKKCGNEMVLRNGSRGNFYGCSSYPKCRNTKEIV